MDLKLLYLASPYGMSTILKIKECLKNFLLKVSDLGRPVSVRDRSIKQLVTEFLLS